MKFTVFVDDNFHKYDESERYTFGEFSSCEEALAAAKQIVDRSLTDLLPSWIEQRTDKTTFSTDDFYGFYTGFGEDPFIISDGETACKFSAWDYAKIRCREIVDSLSLSE